MLRIQNSIMQINRNRFQMKRVALTETSAVNGRKNFPTMEKHNSVENEAKGAAGLNYAHKGSWHR